MPGSIQAKRRPAARSSGSLPSPPFPRSEAQQIPDRFVERLLKPGPTDLRTPASAGSDFALVPENDFHFLPGSLASRFAGSTNSVLRVIPAPALPIHCASPSTQAEL